MNKISSTLYLLCICCGFSSCSSVSYLMDMGVGQWKMMNRARPVDEILYNPDIDDNVKNAIRLVQDAKQFAIKELQLKATANYNNYVQLDSDYASYVVTASHPLRLEPKLWKFPVVGKIPYIGFFEEHKAKAFADELKEKKEYWYKLASMEIPPDIHVRGATAYSTLGWLPDPLYSSMTRSGERRIVEVVIHESVHATIFIGSNMDFNERFANFIGLEGSLLYMRNKYGKDSVKYHQAKSAMASEKIFSDFIDTISKQYQTEIEKLADQNIVAALEKKKKFYSDLPQLYTSTHNKMKKQWPQLSPQPWNIDFSSWNNAVLVGYRTYHADFSVFYKLLEKCSDNVKQLMRWMIREYDGNKSAFQENPEAYIQTLANGAECKP